MFKCLEFLLEIAAFTILFSNNAWTANIGLRLYFIYDLICVLMTLSICCNLKENVSLNHIHLFLLKFIRNKCFETLKETLEKVLTSF